MYALYLSIVLASGQLSFEPVGPVATYNDCVSLAVYAMAERSKNAPKVASMHADCRKF